MKLSTAILYDNLKTQVKCTCYGSFDTKLHLGRPEFYTQSGTYFLKDHVYVLQAQMLPARTKVDSDTLIICCGNSIHLSYYREKCRVIVVDGTLDLTELFNQLTRIYNKYDRWADSLQEILNTTADLNSIIMNSRYIFDNPIIIINANFQYLAHSEFSASQVNELSIKNWGNADSTELPLDSFNAFLQNHEISTHVREPLLIKMFGTTTLNVNLFENGEYSGCVTIDYQHRPYRESDDVLARYLVRQSNMH